MKRLHTLYIYIKQSKSIVLKQDAVKLFKYKVRLNTYVNYTFTPGISIQQISEPQKNITFIFLARKKTACRLMFARRIRPACSRRDACIYGKSYLRARARPSPPPLPVLGQLREPWRIFSRITLAA